MKMKFLLFFLTLLATPAAFAQDAYDEDNLYNYEFGYNVPWTAKTLYNASMSYNSTWPQLMSAKSGDVYTVSLPYATSSIENAIVQFKSPINMVSSHTYKFSMTAKATKGNTPQITVRLKENENGALMAAEGNAALTAGQASTINLNGLTSSTIQDLMIEVSLGGNEANTEVELSGISFYDVTEGKELWVGGTFYIHNSYNVDGNQATGPVVSGTTESIDWALPGFDDSQWENTLMPIGNSGFMAEVQTIWLGGDYNNYWIRRNFMLDEIDPTADYTLNILHDDSYKLYVNGYLIDEAEDWTVNKEHISFNIPARFLKVGMNVIATYQKQNWGGKFSDSNFTITPNAHEPADDIDPKDAMVANEIQVANFDQTLDYSYNYGAWLELYNTTDKRVDIGGLYLSDDPANPKKSMLPWDFGVIPAHGYATIFFDHNAADGTFGPTADKQVSFDLNDEGGTIYVSTNAGETFITQNYPAAIMRCSYARTTDATGSWSFTGDPTPGATNSTSAFATSRLGAPVVDTDSKLFDSPFYVQVTVPEGATLRYTTDGSAPTKESAVNTTNNSFYIDSTTILRMRLFQDGYLPGPVVTRSYIYRDKDYYLPVFSISTANDNLYGDSIGVYCDGVNGVEGRNHGKSNINMDWERPVNVEYITPDNRMVINQEAEFSVMGGWSRHFAPASFKLKAKTMFEGKKSFDYPFLPYKPYNKYKVLQIRNGGNDNDNQNRGRVKDGIIQQTLLSSGVYVDCQDYQPTHIFFNGEYIGMLNLREPSNKYFGTANYGYDKDNMDQFEYSNGLNFKAGDKTAFDEWIALSQQYASADFMDNLRQKVDVDEFINYMAGITYIGCSDWICNSNNTKGFRNRDNGKYHMVIFDVEWGFSNATALSQLLGSNANDLIAIFKNSVKNDEFRRQFIDSYCLMGGSVFTPERLVAIGDSIARLIEPALAMENRTPWNSYNDLIPNMTSASRREQHIQALRDNFGLGQGMKMQLRSNISEAQLRVNGLNVPLNKFDGTLFAPIELEASAPAGYNFVGWKGGMQNSAPIFSKGSDWYYYDQGSLDGVEWYNLRAQGNWTEGNAPIGYGKTDIVTTTEANKSCYYLRKRFLVDFEPSAEETYVLNYTVDDGFVLYINGTEVTRYLMPEGDITYDTFATTFATNNPDSGSIIIDASLLQQGYNVIAVEIHNNKLASTDIYWDAELVRETGETELLFTDRTITIDTDKAQSLIAIFEPISSEYLNTAGSTPVVINEVSAGNTIYANDYYKRNDWVELYNTTNQPIDLDGMYISDDPASPQKYQIDASQFDETATDGISPTIIPAHGYKVIWADKLNPLYQLHTNFKLGNADGECVVITAADGSWNNQLDYVAHTGEESVGRYPDAGKRVYKMTRPTIDAMNQLTTYAEWLYGEDENFDPSTISGVETIETDNGEVVSKEYYSVDGMLLAQPKHGINLVRITYSNGKVVTKKILVK